MVFQALAVQSSCSRLYAGATEEEQEASIHHTNGAVSVGAATPGSTNKRSQLRQFTRQRQSNRIEQAG